MGLPDAGPEQLQIRGISLISALVPGDSGRSIFCKQAFDQPRKIWS